MPGLTVALYISPFLILYKCEVFVQFIHCTYICNTSCVGTDVCTYVMWHFDELNCDGQDLASWHFAEAGVNTAISSRLL